MKTSFERNLIAILFGGCLFFSIVAIASANTPSDISGHWAEDTLEKWIYQDYVEGYADGTIRPNDPIRRSEVAALINRTFNYEDKAAIHFNDVESGDWFYNDIAIASAAGYMNGNPDGSFKPGKEISRQELAVIITRILNLEASDSYLNFKDTKNSPDWSKGQIGAVIDAEVMTGYTDGTFQPAKPATRAEVMVMLESTLLLNGDNRVIHYNKAGTYGPELGSHTIEGDVVVHASDVTLQNLTITGDLLLAEGIGEGDAFINNVTVKGNTTVEGGGVNSIHFNNSILATITVNKKMNTVRLVVTGSSTVAEVVLQSNARLEESDDSAGTGIENVTLSELLPEDSNVELAGGFETVDIQAKTIQISIPKGSVKKLIVSENAVITNIDIGEEASIVELVLDAITNIVGQGEIENAEINVSGSMIEKEPTTTEIKPGVTAHIGGKQITKALRSVGGSGDDDTSSTPSVVAVSTITVTGADNVTSVVYGETLQMSAAVTPVNATNQTIDWSVAPGTGTATIDASTGLLTATGVGNVTVTATNPASGVTGSLTVNVDEDTSSTPNVVPVSAITVTGADSVTSVVYGETLQMSAAVTPVNATNQTIDWSVAPGTGTATIDTSTGLLTATGVGNVTVTATNTASGVTGSLTVNVDSVKITAATLSIIAPVRGATPQTAAEIEAAIGNDDFTVTSATWNEALTADSKFKSGQAYTLIVVLTSKDTREFQEEAFTPTVANTASVSSTTTSAPGVGNTVSFTVTYEATAAVTSIAVTTQPLLSYIELMPLDMTEMVVTETYSDGSTSLVEFTDGTADGYTTSIANGTSLSGSDNARVITITHTSSDLTATTGTLSVFWIPVFPDPGTLPGF